MTRALSTIAAGWLLVTYHGGTIAWYETKYDTEKPPLPTLPTDHLNQLLRLP